MKLAIAFSATLVLFAALPAGIYAQQTDSPLVARARRILDQVPIIDGHNDLPSAILERADADPARFNFTQPQSDFHTDLPRLKAGRVGAQFWSAYISNDSIPVGAA
jgi:membrane dipeptidase